MTFELPGLPGRLQAAQSGAEREWMVMEWSLTNLEPEVRAAVWATAIPHWFDLDYLAALLDRPAEAARPIFQRLITLSYLEVFPGRGYNVHERTRNLLLDRLWRDDQLRFRGFSELASEFCMQQDQTDTSWRVEFIYHGLTAGAVAIVDLMESQAREWYNRFEFDKLELLAKSAFEAIVAGRVTDSRVHAICFEALGDVHLRWAEYSLARVNYLKALENYRAIGDWMGQANCMQALGDVHMRFEEYEDARLRFEEAQPIYRALGDKLDEANCVKALGDIHVRLSKFPLAQERYEHALRLYQMAGVRLGEANCIKSLGDVHVRMSNHEAARTYYERALRIYRKMNERIGEANCTFAFAELDRVENRWSAAEAKYLKALEQFQAVGIPFSVALALQRLGHIARATGKLNTAREYYQEALILLDQMQSPITKEVRFDIDMLGEGQV